MKRAWLGLGVGLILALAGCGGGGGGGGGGNNTGMSNFTGSLSGAATGTFSGTLEGTSGGAAAGNMSVITIMPPVTLPTGVTSVAMSLYIPGSFATKEYSAASDFAEAAVAVSTSANANYGASLAAGMGSGMVDLKLTNVEDNGTFVIVKGSVDATLLNGQTGMTDTVTVHMTF